MFDRDAEQLNIFDYSQKKEADLPELEGSPHERRVKQITNKLYSNSLTTGITNCSKSCFVEKELNLT